MAPTSRVTQEKGELVSAGGRCAGSACRCRPLALKGWPVLSMPTVWACSAVWRGGATGYASHCCKGQLASKGQANALLETRPGARPGQQPPCTATWTALALPPSAHQLAFSSGPAARRSEGCAASGVPGSACGTAISCSQALTRRRADSASTASWRSRMSSLKAAYDCKQREVNSAMEGGEGQSGARFSAASRRQQAAAGRPPRQPASAQAAVKVAGQQR